MRNLGLKSILGITNLLFWMGLAIFLSAGTLHFPAAWIYLALFFIPVTAITVFIFNRDKDLLQRRMHVGPVAETRKAQKIIQSFAAVGFIGMYIVSGLDRRFGWTTVPLWLMRGGEILMLIAMYFLFLVFRRNSFLSALIEVDREQTVITDGPYAIVRHPMYAAALLLFIATPFALGSFAALIFFPLMFAVLMLRCLDEEKMLRRELNGYTAYCDSVPYRLIPFIW